MAKRKTGRSIDEHDIDTLRERASPKDNYHIGDGLHRLRRRHRIAVLGYDPDLLPKGKKK